MSTYCIGQRLFLKIGQLSSLYNLHVYSGDQNRFVIINYSLAKEYVSVTYILDWLSVKNDRTADLSTIDL